jgi:hypothetical protein
VILTNISILLALTAAAFAQDSASDETQVWNLEKAYWKYVKANDLEKYRALWHESFVGWPTSSSTPLRKDHITHWITRKRSSFIFTKSELDLSKAIGSASGLNGVKTVIDSPGEST